MVWPTLQTNKREKKWQFTPPEGHDFKTCEKLTHCSRAKNIIGEIIWLLLKRTHLVHPWKIMVHLGVYVTTVYKHCTITPFARREIICIYWIYEWVYVTLKDFTINETELLNCASDVFHSVRLSGIVYAIWLVM